MRKNYLLMASMAIAIIVSSCTKPTALVTFLTSLETTTTDLSKSSSLSQSTLTSLDIVENGTTLTHVGSTDPEWSSAITLPLSYGSHSLNFIAHNCPSVTYAANSITPSEIRDLHLGSTSLQVTSETATTPISLSRMVYALQVRILDQIPSTSGTLVVTIPSYNHSLFLGSAPLQCSGTSASSTTFTLNLAALSGSTSATLTIYGFPSSMTSANNTNVNITLLNAQGNTTYSNNLTVPIQRNHLTTLQGRLFSSNQGFSVTISDDWVEDTPINF